MTDDLDVFRDPNRLLTVSGSEDDLILGRGPYSGVRVPVDDVTDDKDRKVLGGVSWVVGAPGDRWKSISFRWTSVIPRRWTTLRWVGVDPEGEEFPVVPRNGEVRGVLREVVLILRVEGVFT